MLDTLAQSHQDEPAAANPPTMASAISKRQQARNERALQELIRTVAGNDRCADCSSKNPGWASWNLGIFLCLRCATIHRKMGTHISKVKSLSMDSWTTDQVETMRHMGNAASNGLYNPRNAKASMPLDVDEVDSAMEKYIRQKYQHRTLQDDAARSNAYRSSASTSSDERPPLPPKPNQRAELGARSASSIFPVASQARSRYEGRSTSPNPFQAPRPAPRQTPSAGARNKPSQVFGATVIGTGGSLEAKLTRLKEMGFVDEARNATILVSTDGSLERAVEAMVAMGERAFSASGLQTTPPAVSPAAQDFDLMPPGNASLSTLEQSSNTNPFSTAAFVQPLPGQGGVVGRQPPAVAGQSRASGFEYASIACSVEVPQQQRPSQPSSEPLHVSRPLFPHSTGGMPAPRLEATLPRQAQTPPVPSAPYFQSQYGAQYRQQPRFATNPFLASYSMGAIPEFHQPQQAQQSQEPQQPQQLQRPQHSQELQYSLQLQQPQQPQQPEYNQKLQPPHHPHESQYTLQLQQPEQLQQSQYARQLQEPQQPQQPQYTQQPQQSQQPHRPQQLQQAQTSWQHSQYPVQPLPAAAGQVQPTLMFPQPNGRADKSAIMALFNYPQLAPARPPGLAGGGFSSAADAPAGGNAPPSAGDGQQPPPRSVSSPVEPQIGSRNPFARSAREAGGLAGVTGGGKRADPARHVSQDSMDLSTFASRPHSPDAFAHLSARSMR